MATRALGRKASQVGGASALDAETRRTFQWIITYLADAWPREISLQRGNPPVLVFTDGACEGELRDDVTVGAIVFCRGRQPEFFGMAVPDRRKAEWLSTGVKQTIGQAELYPILLAKLTWKDLLRGQRAIYFVDNDSARFAAIRCYSPSLTSSRILWEIAEADAQIEGFPWYARVPSKGNPADGPSRLDYRSAAEFWGARMVQPTLPDIDVAAVEKGGSPVAASSLVFQ